MISTLSAARSSRARTSSSIVMMCSLPGAPGGPPGYGGFLIIFTRIVGAVSMKSAYNAVAELIYTYAERLDGGDFEALADLFANAELTTEGMDIVSRGREEVLATYTNWTRRYPDDGTPKTKHVMTNLIVDVDEGNGTAASRSYFTVLQAVPGVLSLQPIVAGRYRDRFECVDGVWRFTSMHIIIDLMGDLSQHGLAPLDVGGE